MLMYQMLNDFTEKDGNSPALLYMGKYISYASLFSSITDAAKKLSNYVKNGDVATICMPNTPECIYCFYALNRLGVVAHMVHPLSPVNQLKKFMKAAHSKLLITLSINLDGYASLSSDYPIIAIHPARSLGKIKKKLFDIKVKPYKGDMNNITWYDDIVQSKLPPAPNRLDTTTGVYLHSGGTGGEPKIIEISDAAVNNLAKRGLEALDALDAHGKYMLAALPMFHGFGLSMCVHAILTHGGVSVLMPKFDAKLAVKLIKKNKLHFLVGVPALYKGLLRQKSFKGKGLKNMYIGFIGGDCAPTDLLNEFNDRLIKAGSKARLFEGYGLTETVANCAVNNFKHNRFGSMGYPMSNILIKVINPETQEVLSPNTDGEIVVSSDTVMNGYLNNPDENATAFVEIEGVKYVRTGDFGHIDCDGYLYFVQRLKRIIKIAGISVYPKEIEYSACELEGVTASCAVEYKQNGKTFIALFYTGKEQDEVKVKEKIQADLSRYAVPKIVKRIDEIPMTAYSKVNTLDLAQRAEEISKGENL